VYVRLLLHRRSAASWAGCMALASTLVSFLYCPRSLIYRNPQSERLRPLPGHGFEAGLLPSSHRMSPPKSNHSKREVKPEAH